MSRKSSKQLAVAFVIFIPIGLLALVLWLMQRSPQAIIRRALQANQLPEQTIKFWIAVSAFETTGWTSAVFKASNNLFALIVPGKPKLAYGEGQTVYATLQDAAADLYPEVLKPFGYPANFVTLQDMVSFMNSKGYFTSSADDYYYGVSDYYNKLFPNG